MLDFSLSRDAEWIVSNYFGLDFLDGDFELYFEAVLNAYYSDFYQI